MPTNVEDELEEILEDAMLGFYETKRDIGQFPPPEPEDKNG